MPSLGEAPSGGARAFCLLLRFSKVSRRQGGTLSSRYRSNGYVLDQHTAIASKLAPTGKTEPYNRPAGAYGAGSITGSRPNIKSVNN
ncbi:hypothetical protein BSF43_51750 [Pseudomonas ogarae]|nr:hypothetical protein BSF43_51750 [Pseudomonas ogarae]